MNKTDLVFYFEKGITGLCNLIKGIFICLEEKKNSPNVRGMWISTSLQGNLYSQQRKFFLFGGRGKESKYPWASRFPLNATITLNQTASKFQNSLHVPTVICIQHPNIAREGET
jgi:hypothetical protein